VLVQPAALVRGLGATLPENVRVYEDSPVREIVVGKPHTLVTDRGRITAPRLILANNAYASQFDKLGLKGLMLPIYTYGSLTRRLTPEELATLELGPDSGRPDGHDRASSGERSHLRTEFLHVQPGRQCRREPHRARARGAPALVRTTFPDVARRRAGIHLGRRVVPVP
jgi:glycine/D-amino acid oxidase-like deaminating enzyme